MRDRFLKALEKLKSTPTSMRRLVLFAASPLTKMSKGVAPRKAFMPPKEVEGEAPMVKGQALPCTLHFQVSLGIRGANPD